MVFPILDVLSLVVTNEMSHDTFAETMDCAIESPLDTTLDND